MYQTTTPTFRLSIPYEADEINDFILSFVQQGKTVFTFTRENCVVTDKEVMITLTQEQSAVFVHRYPIHIQLRIMLNSGVVVSSAVEHVYVHRSLDDTVLTIMPEYYVEKTDETTNENYNIDLDFSNNDTDIRMGFA